MANNILLSTNALRKKKHHGATSEETTMDEKEHRKEGRYRCVLVFYSLLFKGIDQTRGKENSVKKTYQQQCVTSLYMFDVDAGKSVSLLYLFENR